MKMPYLETIARSVRNIDSSLQQRSAELDELGMRMDLLQVANIKSPAKGTPKTQSAVNPANENSVSRQAAAKPSSEVARAVAAALNAERAGKLLKSTFLELRKEPFFNRTALEQPKTEEFSDLRSAMREGPITSDRLPTPRRAPQPRDSTPKRPTFFSPDDSYSNTSPSKQAAASQINGQLPVRGRGQPSASFKGSQATPVFGLPKESDEGSDETEEEESSDEDDGFEHLDDIVEESE